MRPETPVTRGATRGYYVQARTSYRVTIQEAARRLGVKEPAIRKRIERGTLEKERGDDGRVYVYVDVPPVEEGDTGHDAGRDESHPVGYDALISSQERQIEFLQRELEHRTEEIRRRDVIISQLTQRIPELEPGAPGSAEQERSVAHQETANGSPRETETKEPEPQSWWRRIFS